jgi:hypothetical protein
MNEAPKITRDLSHWSGRVACRREPNSCLVAVYTPEKCTECGKPVWTHLDFIPASNDELSANKIPLEEFLPDKGVVILEWYGLGDHIFCPSCHAEWLSPSRADYE